MNDYSKATKEILMSLISKMSMSPERYVKNPGKDFTRNRKLPFADVVKLLVSMGGNSIYKELLESQGYDVKTATSSAFVQQRDKILPCAFEFLFHEFTEWYTDIKKYRGYRLLATDGSDLRTVSNPQDSETYLQNQPDGNGYNLLHLNAIYDLCNRLYLDALMQPKRLEDEKKALISMIGRSCITDQVIIIADRNYENYNCFAYIENRGWNYLIRVKDIDSNGIVSGLSLPSQEEFDICVQRILTRSRENDVLARPDIYRVLYHRQPFDFLDLTTNKFYPISFRVVRLKLSDGSFETVITNLDSFDFPSLEIKKLYKIRWGIETSFRELKYAVGLVNFHSKKREHVIQEVFAKIIMHNFAEMITSHVVISQTGIKHVYQVNFTVAIHICRRFLSCLSSIPPPDVETLIRKNTLPVRPDRKAKRKARYKSAVSFLYRVV